MGQSTGWAPKGAVMSSWPQPPRPLIGRGNDAHVGVAGVAAGGLVELGPQRRQQVDRQHVHGVQQEDPDEHGERQRGDELAARGVVDVGARLVVHHLDEDLDRGLEAPRNAGGRLARGQPQHEAADHADHQRIEHGVEVDDIEVDDRLLGDGFETPVHLPVLQMVNDVFTRGRCVSFGGHLYASL
jgi:hypothetical protein